ncbi:MAG: cytochrome d ubiquinol oxidase subunit II, partial [Verrucomicrobia bacterium]|nr:cytochrome d ubiquinol oxidase subunit II [Verrucomicrobiota bacterium]
MDLQTIWYILIAVLFIGYFFLEGFDFGVGILLPFVGRDDTDRRVLINTIGPFWDANEVWVLTAGGAMFAAFPHWYATMFSGFYLALLLILVGLIVRAVGLEFRAKIDNVRWRHLADAGIFWGSLIPTLIWGVGITNLVRGVPIGPDKNFMGNLFGLLNPYSLLGGIVAIVMFALHGAVFLSLRTAGDLQQRVRKVARGLWLPGAIVMLLFAIWGRFETDLFYGFGVVPGTLPFITALAFIAAYVFMRMQNDGWAFAATGFTIVTATVVAFQGLYPRVMPSSLNHQYDLTIYNASSSSLTLT